jgi:hypothetical protein
VSEQSAPSQPTRRAGLFDLRMIIALLFGIYGAVLTVVGIGFTTKADLDKAGGIHVNLWCGAGMFAVALAFVAWVGLRPLRVPEPAKPEPAIPEPAKPEPAKAERAKPEPAKPEPEEPAEPADAG